MSGMIPNPEKYFGRFIPPKDSLLLELEEEARTEGIPIVGPVVGQLLHLLAGAVRAEKILELGTATGYSTIFLARGCGSRNGTVVTVELDTGMAARARESFQKAGLDRRIRLEVGDALSLMTDMNGPFDMVFMDIDKEAYLEVLPQCHRLLRPGGFLVADNVGFSAANKFNRAIFDDSRWEAVHLLSFLPRHSPEKDGLCLALRL
ncbi:O-methyltransferase [Thermodesulfobacteriota bacterium]